jgi:hypothetical protein
MNSVAKAVGRYQSTRVIINSLSITVIIVFYSLSIGSYFEPDVYRFQDRLTFHQHFEEQYFFNEFVDHVVISLSFLIWSIISIQNKITKWILSVAIATILSVSIAGDSATALSLLSIISLPFIIITNILHKILRQLIVSHQLFALTLNYLLISVAILSVFSIFVSISSFSINDPFIDMFVLLSRFSPIVMLLLIFSFPLKVIYSYIYENVSKISARIPNASDLPVKVYTRISESEFNHGQLLLIIGSSMALSMVIVLIPNTDHIQGPIAEDTLMYVNWTEDLQSSADAEELLQKGFVEIAGGDRPLPLFLIFLLSNSFALSKVTIIEFILPMFLAPTLVLVTYYLTKELSPNILVALFICFITAISFQVVIGMYAGLFANWIALLPSYISLVYLLRFLKTSRRSNLLLFSVFLVILLLIHVYTWTIIMAFAFLFGIISWLRKAYPSELIKLVFIALFIIVAIDVARGLSTGSTFGLTRDLVLAQSTNFGFAHFDVKWSNLVHTTEVFKAGIFGNIILLSLAVYGVLLLKYRNVIDIFVLVFVSIAILPFLFGDKIILSRVLYDIPFQIPVGLAMTNVLVSKYGKLKIICIVLSLLAAAVYVMFNIGSIEQNI